MKRCLQRPAYTVIALVLAQLAIGLPTSSLAQTPMRAFPATAKRAVLEVTQSPEVLLDGAPRRLSAGARIRAVNNLLVMPATLTGQRVLVHYLTDAQGLLHEVWILSAQEAAQTGRGVPFASDGNTMPPTDQRP